MTELEFLRHAVQVEFAAGLLLSLLAVLLPWPKRKTRD